MNSSSDNTRRYWPLAQLIGCRMREFSREPEAWIWTYGFPIIVTIALGIAFRNKPATQVVVDIVENPLAVATQKALSAENSTQKFKTEIVSSDQAQLRLRAGKTDIVVTADQPSDQSAAHYEYRFDPTRPESVLARNAVDDQLQRAGGRRDVATINSVAVDEPGGRYIDFLVPGLLGVNLLGGGMWGVGFVTVEMRIRKLLKRFLATPMKRWQFLVSVMSSRFIFSVAQALILLIFARYAFDVPILGSALAVAFLIVLGSIMFFGIGLLLASRVKTQDAIFGLMNLVQIPMWILSGIFFSSDRFPDAMQPFIKALPLTPLINSLRAVMLEGATLWSQAAEIGIMAAWAIISFALALRLFRWQ
ncbi:MAG TPA: ABC transporter permease [Pirellulales bacterium]|jgi:ABC-type multidrug transport system permease subunit|nr:ABC transporter permease [Pirellulales bacterium]